MAVIYESDMQAALLAKNALAMGGDITSTLAQCFAEYRHAIGDTIMLKAADLSRAKNHVQGKVLGEMGARICNGDL